MIFISAVYATLLCLVIWFYFEIKEILQIKKKKKKKKKKEKGDSQNKKINKDFGINETCPFGKTWQFLRTNWILICWGPNNFLEKKEFLLVGEEDNLKERLAASKRFLVSLFKYCKNMCKLKSIIKKTCYSV